MVDAIWMNNRIKMFSIGPVLTLEGLWIGEKSYNNYTNGNWMGLLCGLGGKGVFQLKNENAISARLSIAGSIVNNCWFTKNTDSASSADTAGRIGKNQYSDRYLENLKKISKEYDRYIFPLYANLEYTKYAHWIFVGAGFNGFCNIEIEKVRKSVEWPREFSTYLHFGVRFRKNKANLKIDRFHSSI